MKKANFPKILFGQIIEFLILWIRPVLQNHGIPYFLEKSFLPKTLNSLFFGLLILGEALYLRTFLKPGEAQVAFVVNFRLPLTNVYRLIHLLPFDPPILV